MTINNAIQTYLNWKQSNTRTTYQSYANRLWKFEEYLNKTELSEITEEDVTAFHSQMKGAYSDTTIAYSARILKDFFKLWYRRGETTISSEEIIPIQFTNPYKEIVTPEDFEDMNDILDANFFEDLQKKLIIHLLWDTAMRVSELCDMELSNINNQGRDGLRTAKVRTRKSLNYNLIVWGSETDELLTKYLGIRICIDAETDRLFINRKTEKPYSIRTIQRWIKELGDLALDKDITPHSFRHGKAHYILDQGGSVRDVSAILRHVNPQSSFNYLKLNETRYLNVAGKYLTTT